MKRNRFFPGVLSALSAIAIGLAGGCSSVRWEGDYQAGMQKAAGSRQRALLHFTSGFDAGSSQMQSDVFGDPNVETLLARFVPIRLNLGLHRRLAEQFEVTQTPTFLVLRPDGSVAGRQTGAMTADKFRHFLIKHSYN